MTNLDCSGIDAKNVWDAAESQQMCISVKCITRDQLSEMKILIKVATGRGDKQMCI